MFKFASKLILLSLVFTGLGLLASGGKAFAAHTCPGPADSNKPDNWGINTGPVTHGYASLTVRAIDARTGLYIDQPIHYQLNSKLPPGHYGTPPPGHTNDERIFQWYPGDAGRASQKWFSTGGDIFKLHDGSATYSCPGWDQLGPGTSDKQGNQWVLDCAETDNVTGAEVSTRFWLSGIDTPSGQTGHWSVYASVDGKPYNAGGGLVTDNFTTDPMNPNTFGKYFTVTNGVNARLDLVWHADNTPLQGQIINAVCQTVVATNIKGENSFGDATGNLPVKLRFHNGGASSAVNTTYSGNSSGGGYSHPTPGYVQDRTTNIDVAVDLLVKDYSRSGAPYIQVDSKTIDEPCGNNSTCPSIPVNPTQINLTGNGSKVPVQSGNWNDGSGNLHQQNSYINDHLGDDSNLKGNGDIVWGDSANVGEFQYVIQKITDQYGQDISVPTPHWSPQTKSPNPFNVNWTPFINQYPYDSHALNVIYTTWYRSYKYKATTAARDWIPGHWEGSGTDRHWVPGHWGPIKGYRLVYQGTYVYNWHTDPNDSESHPGNGNWAKAECYDRGFQVHDIDGSATLNGDNESPSGATFTFSIPVHFSLPQGDTALRNPNKVCGLNFNADYYIKHADGSSGGSMPGHPSDSGGLGGGGCLGGNWSDDVTDSFTRSYSTTLIPPMVAGDKICMRFSVGPAAGTMNEGGSITSVSQANITSPERCSDKVVDKPYVRVYGADAIAGNTCPNPANSRITAYRSTDPAKSGSGVQFAALAIQGISGFGSASTSSSWPTGLTFANTDNITSGGSNQPNDGGLYNGEALCGTDFYGSQVSPIGLNVSSTDPSDLSSRVDSQNGGKATQFLRNGDLTINGGTFDKQATVFVNGNVSITGDLAFPVGKYLSIVAKGNIYIGKDVHNLDGLYVAQANGASGGNIYTCAEGFTEVHTSGLYDKCHSQLVINGAFVAQYVAFLRSVNSLRDSQAGESAGTTKAAEIFKFSPEIYLYTPTFKETTTGDPYQYITTLPPVL